MLPPQLNEFQLPIMDGQMMPQHTLTIVEYYAVGAPSIDFGRPPRVCIIRCEAPPVRQVVWRTLAGLRAMFGGHIIRRMIIDGGEQVPLVAEGVIQLSIVAAISIRARVGGVGDAVAVRSARALLGVGDALV